MRGKGRRKWNERKAGSWGGRGRGVHSVGVFLSFSCGLGMDGCMSIATQHR